MAHNKYHFSKHPLPLPLLIMRPFMHAAFQHEGDISEISCSLSFFRLLAVYILPFSGTRVKRRAGNSHGRVL